MNIKNDNIKNDNILFINDNHMLFNKNNIGGFNLKTKINKVFLYLTKNSINTNTNTKYNLYKASELKLNN